MKVALSRPALSLLQFHSAPCQSWSTARLSCVHAWSLSCGSSS